MEKKITKEAKVSQDDFWKVSTGPTPHKVRVTTIRKSSEIPGAETVSKYNEKIEYPISIKIECEGYVVSEDTSTKSTWAKDWNTKFYIRKYEDKEYVEYTRHAVLLALFKIMEAQGLEPVDDYRDLVGFEFDAILVGDPKAGFINWYQTFRTNKVPVPTLEDLKPKQAATSFEDENVKEVDNTETIIEPDSLPF